MARIFASWAAGELSADAPLGSVALQSPAFETLPIIAGEDFLDIVIDMDGLMAEPGQVRITGHALNATTVTVDATTRAFKKGMDWVAPLTQEALTDGLGGGGGGGGAGSITTVLIATTDSPLVFQAAASYLCDEVADQTQFQQAIDDAGVANFDQLYIYVAPGNYNFSAPITNSGGLSVLKIFRPSVDMIYYDTPEPYDVYINNVSGGPILADTGNFRNVEFEGVGLDMGETGYLCNPSSYCQYTFKNMEIAHWWDASPSWITGNFDIRCEGAYFYSYSSNPTFRCTNPTPLGWIRDCYIDVDVDLPTTGAPGDPAYDAALLQGGVIRFESTSTTWDQQGHWQGFAFENNLIAWADRPLITTESFMSRIRVERNWINPSRTYNAPYAFEFNDSSFIDVRNNHFSGSGVRASGCRDVTISGNTFWEADAHAVVLVDSNNSEIVGNRILDPGLQTALTYSGIFLDGTSSENFIADNRLIVRLNVYSGAQGAPLHGIRININTCVNNRLRDNWLHEGLDISDSGTGTFSANAQTVIEDELGEPVGYVGYTADWGVSVFHGDLAAASAGNAPILSLTENGSYLQAPGGMGWLNMDDLGSVIVGGSTLKLLKETVAGVDGTATPTTVAELADVLVDLGIIASHTIT